MAQEKTSTCLRSSGNRTSSCDFNSEFQAMLPSRHSASVGSSVLSAIDRPPETVMKKLLIVSSAALALSASSAFAADMAMPYKAPQPAPPAYNWTGCYIDGGVGYGMWKQDSYTEISTTGEPLSNTTSFGGNGWLGRLGGGCDYQIGSRFVVGAFADYDFMSVNGQYMDPFTGFLGQENESSSWAAGGRIGYLVTPSLLTYFDGGYTQARFDQINYNSLTPPAVSLGLDTPAQTYHGWFLGGGYEYALSSVVPINGLFWRTEYRFADYQGADIPIVFTATGTSFGLSDHVQKDVQTVTTGLVWRFNFGGPIAARY
jgi:outer membrane immunogenic protein